MSRDPRRRTPRRVVGSRSGRPAGTYPSEKVVLTDDDLGTSSARSKGDTARSVSLPCSSLAPAPSVLPEGTLIWIVWPLLTMFPPVSFHAILIGGRSALMPPVKFSGDCCDPTAQAAFSALKRAPFVRPGRTLIAPVRALRLRQAGANRAERHTTESPEQRATPHSLRPASTGWRTRVFPMEAHFVHANAARNGYTVIGVFMEAGDSNPAFAKITATMPREPGRIAPTDADPRNQPVAHPGTLALRRLAHHAAV